MNYQELQHKSFQNGFNNRIGELLIKEAMMYEQLTQEEGMTKAGGFIEPVVNLLGRGARGFATGAARMVGRSAGSKPGGLSSIAKALWGGLKGEKYLPPGVKPPPFRPHGGLPDPNVPVAPVPNAGVGPNKVPGTTPGTIPGTPEMDAAAAAAKAEAAGGAGGLAATMKGMIPEQYHQLAAGATGGLVGAGGVGAWDWNKERIRRNRIREMGFGNRLGLALQLMMNPSGVADMM